MKSVDLINTPSLLKNLPRQKPNLDLEDDSQDLENEQAAGTETGMEAATEGEAGQPDNQTDNQTILRLLEEGEMVSLHFRL